MVLGTLQDALQVIGTAGDTALLPLIGSITGQQGKRNTFYRSLVTSSGFKPSSKLPFLTRLTETVLFAYLNQTFFQPQSCILIEKTNLLQLPHLGEFVLLDVAGASIGNSNMNIASAAQADSEQVVFQIQPSKMAQFQQHWQHTKNTFSIAYINQQKQPYIGRIDSLVNITESDATGAQFTFPMLELKFHGPVVILLVDSTDQRLSTIEHVMETAQYGPYTNYDADGWFGNESLKGRHVILLLGMVGQV